MILRGQAFGVDKHERCALVSTRTGDEIEGQIILAGKEGEAACAQRIRISYLLHGMAACTG